LLHLFLLKQGFDETPVSSGMAVYASQAMGLLCAGELGSDHLVTKVIETALSKGSLVTPTWNRLIRLIPPLIVTQA